MAIEALEEKLQSDHVLTKEKEDALNAALEGVEKRIKNLTDLKISPDNSDGSLLSDDEFTQRRKSLLQEKDKLLNQVQNAQSEEETWGNLARESFRFGLNAKKKFIKNISDDKKYIVKEVYSNLILLDQKLQFQPRYFYFIYKKGIKIIK